MSKRTKNDFDNPHKLKLVDVSSASKSKTNFVLYSKKVELRAKTKGLFQNDASV